MAEDQQRSGARLFTVRDRHLSLWQSAAEEQARKQLGPDAPRSEVLNHPVVQEVTAHALAGARPAPPGPAPDGARGPVPGQVSQAHLEHAQQQSRQPTGIIHKFIADTEAALGHIERLGEEIWHWRRYSNLDMGFLGCEAIYLRYLMEAMIDGVTGVQYRDCGGDQTKGMIGYQLPAGARVAIIGDWGTGMDDARALLDEVVGHRPDAIIHLGDIYYSGTREECGRNFADLVDKALAGRRVPVFTIPGNHDYYDWGRGFYDLLDHRLTPADQPTWRQPTSYFCLRSADGRWQFLGMDTAQSDTDPLARVNPRPATLRTSEVGWLLDKLDPSHFAGSTVLLSHHQPFSAHAPVDVPPAPPYRNDGLLNALAPRLDRVAAWFWGHEHNFCLYANGLFGVEKGRLVGNSAYEVTHDEDPYRQVYPEVGYQLFDGQPVKAGMTGGFYNHTYAIVDLASDSVSYFQIPSWGDDDPKVVPDDQRQIRLGPAGSERLTIRGAAPGAAPAGTATS